MSQFDQTILTDLFSPEQIEQIMGPYLQPCYREDASRVIRLLAEGDECRQQDLVQTLGKNRGGTSSRPIKELLKAGGPGVALTVQ